MSTGETIDAVTALAAVDASRRDLVRAALRAALVKDDAHDDAFDRLFELFFPAPRVGRQEAAAERTDGSRRPEAADLRDQLTEALRQGDDDSVGVALEDAVEHWAGIDGATPGSERHHLQRVLRRLELGRVLQELMRGSPDRTELERQLGNAQAHAQLEEVLRILEQLVRERLHDTGGHDAAPRPHAQELQDLPVMHAAPHELAALRSAVRPLARHIATRLGRRRRGRGRLDMRRTIRDSMSSGGVPHTPRMRRRHPSKPDLVVLCDVSGSVAQFAPFTLSLLHALHEEFRRVRSWVFIDGIVEVTDFLQAAPGVVDVHHLLGRRGLVAGDGRSDYGRAFAEHLRRWPDAVTGKTTVLVIGDARTHDRLPALAETKELHRLSRRLYWFNPEPRHQWDTGDSSLSLYAAHATRVFEVSTLRQLGDAVTHIAT
ncbi:VWA domain-containing protein [Streptomyces spinoverrucosus]|uniref:VWA domain-containing protein n=1 Tax=Streptomyces spinoverrucosus TaxID=284043 RepID=A0A4Y3VCG8_9ACTN|nr:VWA domain-containing protein [Streptomyces spinoverrucosus]GEC03261.1 VWA domain-containing protein [Streptomyces spinoverrucosus]